MLWPSVTPQKRDFDPVHVALEEKMLRRSLISFMTALWLAPAAAFLLTGFFIKCCPRIPSLPRTN